MKTLFYYPLYSILLTLVLLSPTNLLANDDNQTNQSVQSTNDFENDYPYYYEARIKRFHRPYQGFDYYSPAYVDLNNYSPIFTLGLTIYNGTPFENSTFEDWNRFDSSIEIYRYYTDATYQERVDIWNRIYNPNWRYFSSPLNALSHYNFNEGFGLAGSSTSLYQCSAIEGFYVPNNFMGFIDFPNLALNYISNRPSPFTSVNKITVINNGPQQLGLRTPIKAMPLSVKNRKVTNRVVSMQKTTLKKEDFYAHVTIKTKKRLPKNWRTLSPSVRALYDTPSINALTNDGTNSQIEYSTSSNLSDRNTPQSTMPKTSSWNVAPKVGNSSVSNKKAMQTTTQKRSGNSN